MIGTLLKFTVVAFALYFVLQQPVEAANAVRDAAEWAWGLLKEAAVRGAAFLDALLAR